MEYESLDAPASPGLSRRIDEATSGLIDAEPASAPGSATADPIRALRRAHPVTFPSVKPRVETQLERVIIDVPNAGRAHSGEIARLLAVEVRRRLDGDRALALPQRPATVIEFSQRHRVLVGSTLGLILVLLTVASLAVGVAIKSNRAAELASENAYQAGLVRDQATLQRDAAQKTRAAAEAKARQAARVTEFMTALVGSAEQLRTGARTALTAEQVAGRAAEVFGPDRASAAAALFAYGSLARSAGRLSEAEAAMRQCLEIQTTVLGADDPSPAATLGALASIARERGRVTEAEGELRRALAIRRRLMGSQSAAAADTAGELASLLAAGGNPQRQTETREMFDAAIAGYRASLGPVHPRLLEELLECARWLTELDQLEEAGPMLAEALTICAAMSEPPANLALQARVGLCTLHLSRRELALALPLYRELDASARKSVLDGGTARCGSLVAALAELAAFAQNSGDVETAEAAAGDATTWARTRLSAADPARLAAVNALLTVRRQQTRLDDAATLWREVIEGRKAAMTGEPDGARAMAVAELNAYGSFMLATRRDRVAASAAVREAVELAGPLGAGDEAAIAARVRFADLAFDCGQVEDPLLRGTVDRVLEYVLATTRPGDARTMLWLERAATLAEKAGDWPAAANHVGRLLDGQRGAAKAEPFVISQSLVRLAEICMKRSAFADAERMADEALVIRAGMLPTRHWMIGHAQSLLGGAIAAQGRVETAEPLLLEGQRAMAESFDTPIEVFREGLGRLASLYEEWGRPELAAHWRKQLDKKFH